VVPHAQQGVHVRLTVHAEGSRGADTKFKEFWVGPCGETPPTSTPPTTGGPHPTTTEPGSGPGTPPGTPPGDGPGGSTPATTAGIVPSQGSGDAPATITPSASTADASASGTLPDTGSDMLPLVAAGLALAGLGSGSVLAARLRRSGR
jgi:LPXTG-motif cell wall-anchored protein